MPESIILSLTVGTVLGVLTGLGVGGGSLLVLWLTLVLNYPQSTAIGVNLLFFLPSAVISCLLRWKQGTLDIKACLPGMLAGCAAAALGSWISAGVDTAVLRKPFGILLLITGLRELTYRRR